MAENQNVHASTECSNPRLYFDLVDTRSAQQSDDDSFKCSFVAAEALAQNLALRMGGMEPEFLAGYSILVTNKAGKEIIRVPVSGLKRQGRTSHDIV